MDSKIDVIDVLCVGQASYDLVFSVPYHPAPDEKMRANNLLSFGGGPAANAAVMVSRLGFKSAFSGFLSLDLFGQRHHQELIQEGVNCDYVIRGDQQTPLSSILVKPDGNRALINYNAGTQALSKDCVDYSMLRSKVVLFDGHEPHISLNLIDRIRQDKIFSVLDAGSVHLGTESLMDKVDYLACSEKFAVQYAGNTFDALHKLAEIAPYVIITLGDKGLIWRKGIEQGALPAFQVDVIDTTGAGDAFHGALACALSSEMDWIDALYYASAAGSLCCSQLGARPGLASFETHRALFERRSKIA